MLIEEVRAARDHWLQIWHEKRLELVTETLGVNYVRHEPNGTRTVTAEQYRDEIGATQERIRDVHFKIEDEAITDRTWWLRWTMTGTNTETGEPVTRAGLQVYRVADGRIVETWAATHEFGSTWGD